MTLRSIRNAVGCAFIAVAPLVTLSACGDDSADTSSVQTSVNTITDATVATSGATTTTTTGVTSDASSKSGVAPASTLSAIEDARKKGVDSAKSLGTQTIDLTQTLNGFKVTGKLLVDMKNETALGTIVVPAGGGETSTSTRVAVRQNPAAFAQEKDGKWYKGNAQLSGFLTSLKKEQPWMNAKILKVGKTQATGLGSCRNFAYRASIKELGLADSSSALPKSVIDQMPKETSDAIKEMLESAIVSGVSCIDSRGIHHLGRVRTSIKESSNLSGQAKAMMPMFSKMLSGSKASVVTSGLGTTKVEIPKEAFEATEELPLLGQAAAPAAN